MNPTDLPPAPGWDAIDAALEPLYRGRPPKHYGSLVPYRLGGPDPIHGISAWFNAAPSPHWHFVTYGFTELWGKESEDAEVSGFGFELTFRLARAEDEEELSELVFDVVVEEFAEILGVDPETVDPGYGDAGSGDIGLRDSHLSYLTCAGHQDRHKYRA